MFTHQFIASHESVYPSSQLQDHHDHYCSCKLYEEVNTAIGMVSFSLTYIIIIHPCIKHTRVHTCTHTRTMHTRRHTHAHTHTHTHTRMRVRTHVHTMEFYPCNNTCTDRGIVFQGVIIVHHILYKSSML